MPFYAGTPVLDRIGMPNNKFRVWIIIEAMGSPKERHTPEPAIKKENSLGGRPRGLPGGIALRGLPATGTGLD